MLAAAGGMLFPLLYTWFVTGSSEPTMAARGFAAGAVAGLAVGPFVQPGIAFIIGLIAGATVPFVTYLLDGRLRLQDRTGLIISSGVPALVGLLFAGIFADGVAGSGWQMTGTGSYLGVTGQGVSGLMVESGFAADFPGQLQAQIVGITALGLWGFLTGLVVCVPLGLLFHSLVHRQEAPVRAAAAPVLSPTATQTVYPVSAPYPAAVPTAVPAAAATAAAMPATSTQTAEVVRPPFPPDPFAAPPAQAYAEPARPAQRTEFLPPYTPAEPAPAPAQPAYPEPAYSAEPFPAVANPYVAREGYWPDAPPAQAPTLPADPYQSLEPVTPPSTAALLDSTLDSLTPQTESQALPSAETTTGAPVPVPVAAQPFIGGSPLLRRRKPPQAPER